MTTAKRQRKRRMRRFKIKLKDQSGIDIGVVLAEFIVVAECPEEAELYARNSSNVDFDDPSVDFSITEIPTTD